jgi:DNA-binding MarR family transcriptional regulator
MNQDTVQAGTAEAGTAEAGTAEAGTVQAGTVHTATLPLDAGPLDQYRALRPQAAAEDLECAEAGLSVLIEAWQRAIEELGAMLPPAQVRALLAIEGADGLNVTGLARILCASPSATSRLCDRLVAAGLVTRVPAAASRREIRLGLTESGQRLTAWIRDQRRAALIRVLEAISPDGRAALARGLSELLQR